MSKNTKQNRYLLPDTLRGILVIEMIVYHLLFDLCYMFDVSMPWFHGTPMRLFQLSILGGFVLLSGYCFSFGKKRFARAMQITVCGIIITLVTMVFMPSQQIVFGVLTSIGVCMLLLTALEKPLSKIPAVPGLLIFFILAMLTYGVRLGYIGIFTHKLIDLPDVLYSTPILFPFGLKNANFRSSDYVPLLPWLFVYICGFYVRKATQNNAFCNRILRIGNRPLAFVGRQSLWIYMAHQPILYAVLWLIFHFI